MNLKKRNLPMVLLGLMALGQVIDTIGHAQTATTTGSAGSVQATPTPTTETVLWDQLNLQTIGGKPFDSKKLSGKVVLVVNTASKCGYTPQFKDLQKLYQDYNDKGLQVIGFPSDDFNQDPGSNEEIAKFCEINYGVKFPLMAKGKVKGDEAQPLFKKLTQLSPDKGSVSWNFEKFLVGKDGKVLARFRSGDTRSAIEPKVQEALKKPSH